MTKFTDEKPNDQPGGTGRGRPVRTAKKRNAMKTLKPAAMMREMRLLLEIAIVQDALDTSNTGLWFTYVEWEASRKWLVDMNRSEVYCCN